MIFALQIKKLRESLGLTQEKAAAVLNVSKSILEKWERGERTPLDITQEGAIARLEKLSGRPRKNKEK